MRGLFIRLSEFFGAIGDRVVVDGGDLARRLGAALAFPFRRVVWTLQDRLIWPIADRLPQRRVPVRVPALAVAVVAAGVAGLAVVESTDSEFGTVTAKVSPSPRGVHPPPKAPPAPTLQGATPVFKSAAKDEQPAEPSPKAAESVPVESPAAGSSAAAGSSSAATDKIASTPAAETSTVPATPAGPAAIAVAHRFADAFVVYETGGVESSVRETFGKTASPQLSRALLRRPPRLPADVEVPQAKVLNVVAAPSRGPVYPVSVSLLRLGVTSELRLSMEQQKKKNEWRVTDVLG